MLYTWCSPLFQVQQVEQNFKREEQYVYLLNYWGFQTIFLEVIRGNTGSKFYKLPPENYMQSSFVSQIYSLF